MRPKKLAWFTYLKGSLAVTVILYVVFCLNPAPAAPETSASTVRLQLTEKVNVEPSIASPPTEPESEEAEPPAPSPPCPPAAPEAKAKIAKSEPEDVMRQSGLVTQRQDLVSWINNIATHQELEAMKLLKQQLTTGRDPLFVSRQVQHLRPPDGWAFCVLEGEVCECPEGVTRYGDFDKNEWVVRKEPKTPVLCHNSQYGLTDQTDISPGKIKYCQCRLSPGKCPDGLPVKAERCPGDGQSPCRAGCAAGHKRLTHPSSKKEVTPRAKLCSHYVPSELIWACDPKKSLKPKKGHKHSEAEEILERSTVKLCEDLQVAKEMEVFLECDFLQQYLKWTSTESGAYSPWIEEAYVTYVGGKKDSNYEWQATNLLRSIDLFSSRPLIIVVFGEEFVPPLSWQSLQNVVVLRMRHISRGVSFNFNKVRSMMMARVITGIQLDTDQLIFKGMDQVFEGTRREIHAHHPWPILPVHWMSRDETPGNPYRHYAFKGWDGPQSMRWNHAHPTWTYWALPWLGDLMHERMLAATGRRTSTKVWNLEQTKSGNISVLQLIRQGEASKVKRHVEMSGFMYEDEDMMNVNLWRHKVTKAWCKFDLEPNLFILQKALSKNMYFDPKWYPDGMPVLFLSMHNTKNFDPSDLFLRILEICKDGVEELNCPPAQQEYLMPICKVGVKQERVMRLQVDDYASQVCCCVEPRWSHPVFWSGKWFNSLRSVPERAHNKGQVRQCLIP